MKTLAFWIAIFCVVQASVSSAATLKGKLVGSQFSGYKVVALGLDGKSNLARVSVKGAFSVKVSKGATLQLVNKAGRYAGPIVFPIPKNKAMTAVSGKGGDLGKISLKTGFGIVAGKVQNLFISKSAVRYNKTTGPTGASKLGLVNANSKVNSRVIAMAETGKPGEDGDKDGIPNTVDIDSDGDGQLDVTEEGAKSEAEIQPSIRSTFRRTLSESLNGHSGQAADELIDASIQSGLILGFEVRKTSPKAPDISAVNVDCLGLSYCTAPSGTATLRSDNVRQLEGSPWLEYDPDQNGFPNLASQSQDPNVPFYMGVRPRVARAGLHPGDTILFQINTASGVQSLPVVLPFYFVTVPALKDYVSGGSSGAITYPTASDAPGSSIDKPIVMGDSSVTLTFWKPQRPAIEHAESGSLIDMGKMEYHLTLSPMAATGVILCKPEDFSNPSMTLQVQATPMGYASIVDSSEDAPVESGQPLSFTFNAAACLARNGYSAAGQRFGLSIEGSTQSHDSSNQDLYFQLP